jgi:hypothetical protein
MELISTIKTAYEHVLDISHQSFITAKASEVLEDGIIGSIETSFVKCYIPQKLFSMLETLQLVFNNLQILYMINNFLKGP